MMVWGCCHSCEGWARAENGWILDIVAKVCGSTNRARGLKDCLLCHHLFDMVKTFHISCIAPILDVTSGVALTSWQRKAFEKTCQLNAKKNTTKNKKLPHRACQFKDCKTQWVPPRPKTNLCILHGVSNSTVTLFFLLTSRQTCRTAISRASVDKLTMVSGRQTVLHVCMWASIHKI